MTEAVRRTDRHMKEITQITTTGERKNWPVSRRTVEAVAAGAVVLLVASGSFFTVPQTDVAFIKRFGLVTNPTSPLGPGLHLKWPLIESYDTISTTADTFTLPEKKALTRDTQEITLQAGVTYRKPASSAYHLMYEVGRSGNIDVHPNIIALFNEVERDVISTYSVTDIGGEKRQEVVAKIKDESAKKLAEILKVEVLDVQLPVLDMPQAYKEAASMAATSRTKMVTAQQDADRAKVEAQTRVTHAKAEADANVLKAKGDADAAFARAQADANGNFAKAEADAKGLRLKGEAEAAATRAKIEAAGGVDGLVRQMQAQAGLNWKGDVPVYNLGGAGTGGAQFPLIMPIQATQK